VDLPRSLHKRLKQAALNRDQPMTALVREALTEWLDSQA
jgi:predicted transcriptional regulator